MTKTPARRPPPPIPVSILTGFLGAGKTTLLNELIKDESLSDALVLINEFGEIGLDHLFVEVIDRDMMLMASGCLCCTIRGELIDTLEDLLRRLDNNRIKPFNRVLIETTGLADPAPVMHTIMQHPYLVMRFFPESLITTIDAINGLTVLSTHSEAAKQAAMADVIVITKSDLIGQKDNPKGLAELRARLLTLNPAAVIIDKQHDTIRAADLFSGSIYDPANKSPDVDRWLQAEAVETHERSHGKDSHGHAAHKGHSHHDPNRHDANISACCLRADQPLQPANFELFIKMLREVHGSQLLRVKGIVALADDPQRPLVIHGVQHIFHPPHRLDQWPDADHTTRVVCIVHKIDPDHIRSLWDAFNNVPAIDRADPAALSDNPLNPSRGGLLG